MKIRAIGRLLEENMMLQILQIITFTCFAVFIGFYLLYLTLSLVYVRKAKRSVDAEISSHFMIENPPKVSMIIPTYNEAKVINRKFENLQALHYPKDKLEVVFVDGGSTDETVYLIDKLAKDIDISIKIVKQEAREGFNRAVIEGFTRTTGEIVCITGAETEYDPEALRIMVSKLDNPKIGAVTGTKKIKNLGAGYSPKLELAFRSLQDLLREAESIIDSPFDIAGEISLARRDLVAKLVKNPALPEKGCIDCCISYQAKIDGYRTLYTPEATFSEHVPATVKESFKQLTRRSVTLMQNMLIFKSMILNKEYGGFGLLIMPAHLLMLNFLPFVLLIGTIGLALTVAFSPLNYLVLVFVGILLLATVFSRKLQTFLKIQLVLIVSTLKLLKGTETQKFEKLTTTRA